jgi:hypothetical protein
MSMLAQRQAIQMAETLGLAHDGVVDAREIMGTIGALAERAFLPQQGMSDRQDARLAQKDLAKMSDTELWRENLRAEFVAAWGDDRTGWVVERARAIKAEQRRRAALGK